jgi:transcriptional regulator with XRE-family HTH domain
MLSPTPITPAQCRAARAFLGWNQKELAEKAGVGIVAVNQFETGISEPRRATLEVIRRAFERAGIAFLDENGGGAGLRLRRKRKQPRSSQT